MTFDGLITFQQITEAVQSLSGATGTVTHDCANGSIFYHTSIASNFTANFTNVPTDADRGISVVLVLSQGASAYIPNTVQINGISQTVNWLGGVTPTPTANKKEWMTFTLLRVGATWTVFGQLASYG
jgi:hypothetical protein